MIVVGLTGSIGMGKSTTAAMFEDAGVPVHDADETVHRLYSGRAVPLIEKAFPGTVVDGTVDRDRLSAAVLSDSDKLKQLEAIIHPLVRDEEAGFLSTNRDDGQPVVVLDIPLLFETGGAERVDRVVVVSADAAIQRQRVMQRPGMTEEKFAAILARQVPDSEKRKHADYVIDTGLGMESARHSVNRIVEELKKQAIAG